MKRLFVLIQALFAMQTSFAQPYLKDSVFLLIAKDICAQIIANESTLVKSPNVEVELGLLMLPIYSSYGERLKKVIPGFEMAESDQLEILGEVIGEKLTFSCPAFLKLITNNRTLLQVALDQPQETLIKGTLVKIVKGDFTCIHIRTPQGKVEKLWWMQYFEGANALMDGTNLLNKYLVISYSEHEVYNAAQKDYVKIKVIKNMAD